MAANSGNNGSDPLVKPHVVRMLKDRPRVVDKGVRRNILDHLDRSISENRTPEKLAENASQRAMEPVRKAAQGTVFDHVKQAADKANGTLFKNL